MRSSDAEWATNRIKYGNTTDSRNAQKLSSFPSAPVAPPVVASSGLSAVSLFSARWLSWVSSLSVTSTRTATEAPFTPPVPRPMSTPANPTMSYHRRARCPPFTLDHQERPPRSSSLASKRRGPPFPGTTTTTSLRHPPRSSVSGPSLRTTSSVHLLPGQLSSLATTILRAHTRPDHYRRNQHLIHDPTRKSTLTSVRRDRPSLSLPSSTKAVAFSLGLIENVKSLNHHHHHLLHPQRCLTSPLTLTPSTFAPSVTSAQRPRTIHLLQVCHQYVHDHAKAASFPIRLSAYLSLHSARPRRGAVLQIHRCPRFHMMLSLLGLPRAYDRLRRPRCATQGASAETVTVTSLK